jgi:hypothetical protein
MKKFDMTHRLTPGMLIRAYKQGHGYARLVVFLVEKNFFIATADPVFMEKVPDGDMLPAYLWIENSRSYEFSLSVIGRITRGEPALIFSHTEEVVTGKERKCINALVSLPVRFFILDKGNAEKGLSTEKVVHHGGIITRLSDREATITSMDEITSGALVKLHAVIGDHPMELIAKIDSAQATNNQWTCSLSFSSMSPRDRNRILDYVYAEYRE